MKILHSWLKEFGEFGDDIDAIADHMTALGLAVESVDRVGSTFPGVVVAEVKRLERHPDAAKVQRVFVDAGDGKERHVWCGANNMVVGDKVPLATLGTAMPDGRVIAQRGILGIDSEGMLCSAIELGIGADSSGLMILPSSATLGADVFAAIGVTPDVVFDLDVTRNRPDCFGHLGVARELGARMKVALRSKKSSVTATGDPKPIPVEILDPEGCPRFTVTTMSGVKVCDSPDWIAQRLAHAGMRAINNVVDVSNLVNLELNQPNHAYDARSVERGFVVRRASEGERFTTLDGVERELSAEDLVICNGDDVIVGIAGIMGGLDSEVRADTTTIAVEIAHFDAPTIARSVTNHGLRTEASLRFERGVDPYGAERAIARFAELMSMTCPNLVVHREMTDARTASLVPVTTEVSVRLSRIERVLGQKLDSDGVHTVLAPLGFSVSGDGDTVMVTVPSWRPDCVTEIDLIEEVARHVGYENLGKIVPTSPVHGRLSEIQLRRRLTRQVVRSLGFSEAMPNPFLAPGDQAAVGADESKALRLANPLVAEESMLRTSLRPGLLKAIAYNQSHRNDNIALFEIGHVYPQGSEQLPDEYEALCVMIADADASKAAQVWSQVSSALEVGAQLVSDAAPTGYHGTRSVALRRGKIELGAFGEIDPAVLNRVGIVGRVACLELNLSIVLAETPKPHSAQHVSKFPSTDFDLAFVVADDVAASQVQRALRQAGGALAVDVRQFDVYRGKGVPEGHRSIAYRIRLQAPDKTLTDEAVAEVRSKCIQAVEKIGGSLR
ncbi:MAG: phenylalanine--tRNA ligase subunit beta [Ilumatobacteraceae bacterium]